MGDLVWSVGELLKEKTMGILVLVLVEVAMTVTVSVAVVVNERDSGTGLLVVFGVSWLHSSRRIQGGSTRSSTPTNGNWEAARGFDHWRLNDEKVGFGREVDGTVSAENIVVFGTISFEVVKLASLF